MRKWGKKIKFYCSNITSKIFLDFSNLDEYYISICILFAHASLLQERRRKIFEVEAKQLVLQCTFRNIKQFRSALSNITKEAESRQDQIHGFLSAFIPEYKN